MSEKKIRVRAIILGYGGALINRSKIYNWKSNLFHVIDNIDTILFNRNADGPNWEYFDRSIIEMTNQIDGGDIIFFIANFPLQENYYCRSLSGNKVVISLFEIGEILSSKNIPIENFILRLIYEISFIYRIRGSIPTNNDLVEYAHDETRGCIFDMTGNKGDIVYSCDKPTICDSCTQRIREGQIELELISSCKKEIRKIKRSSFYSIYEFVKGHPILSIIISTMYAIIIGVISSAIWVLLEKSINTIWDTLRSF